MGCVIAAASIVPMEVVIKRQPNSSIKDRDFVNDLRRCQFLRSYAVDATANSEL